VVKTGFDTVQTVLCGYWKKRVVLFACRFMALALYLNFSPSVLAGEAIETTGVAELFHKGARHIGISVGYGVGFRMGPKADRESSRELAGVRLLEVIPRYAIGMSDRLGGDAWYAGSFATVFEGAFFHNTAQNGGYGAGLGATLRYHFLSHERVVPFVDANFGMITLGLDLERQSDGFNFNVGFGGGAHWFVKDGLAITTELRWQHISNADTKQPNDGINAGLFLVGVSWFFSDRN
jgi:hypothetical protein